MIHRGTSVVNCLIINRGHVVRSLRETVSESAATKLDQGKHFTANNL